jgi:hypothetical protein
MLVYLQMGPSGLGALTIYTFKLVGSLQVFILLSGTLARGLGYTVGQDFVRG